MICGECSSCYKDYYGKDSKYVMCGLDHRHLKIRRNSHPSWCPRNESTQLDLDKQKYNCKTCKCYPPSFECEECPRYASGDEEY